MQAQVLFPGHLGDDNHRSSDASSEVSELKER